MPLPIQLHLERHLNILGQIGGYSAFAASWLGYIKDGLGFVGVVAGATLSVWALVDRIQKHRNRKAK